MDSLSALPERPEGGDATYHAGVRPRDAAALVIVRFDADEPRILMGMRHARHVFMPNKFVFPGGRLDRADHALASAAPLASETERVMVDGPGPATSPTRARALALAAIRETYEETGVIVGESTGGREEPPATPGWRDFLSHGFAPATGSLHLLARAITPPGLVRRFDTRFFLTDARAIATRTAPPSDELAAIAWRTFAEAREAEIPVITSAILDLAEARLGELEEGRMRAPVPFFRVLNRRRVIEWADPAA